MYAIEGVPVYRLEFDHVVLCNLTLFVAVTDKPGSQQRHNDIMKTSVFLTLCLHNITTLCTSLCCVVNTDDINHPCEFFFFGICVTLLLYRCFARVN